MNEWIRDTVIIMIVLLLGIMFGTKLAYYTIEKKVNAIGKTINADYCLVDSIDENCLLINFTEQKIKFSYIVLAQAKLESNNFKSTLLKTNNNLFGMKVAATRFTFATNSHDYGSYAKYESIKDCILDYRSWQIQNGYNITNETAYFELLKKVYAEDPNYVNKLKKIIK